MQISIKAIKKHYLAIIFAGLVGFIYFAPYFLFTLKNEYQGIPFMQINDEDNYLMRMREIVDGHPAVGSPNFYEYKNQWPVMPPGSEFFYALPALMFKASIIKVLTASKFILPFVLFLLIYAFLYKVTSAKQALDKKELLFRKINAIAGALLITLGYDFVDYRFMWSRITGNSFPGGWMVWARPVNPIFGAIYLMTFLIALWSLINKTKYKKTAFFFSGLSFALMMASYFFSWGMTLSVLAFLTIIYLIKKNYRAVKDILITIFLAFIFAIPYWYTVFNSRQSEGYDEAAFRTGLAYTHDFVINKFLIFTLIVFVGLIIFEYLQKKKTGERFYFKNWHYFSFSFILGGLWAFNQQVVTGVAIWPYHFVQYSIPLSMIVLMLLLYKIIKPKWKKLWFLCVTLIFITTISYGIYNNYYVYNYKQTEHLERQKMAPLYNFINENILLDSVILVQEKEYDMARNIPIFTHANVYYSGYKYILAPDYFDRFTHNYFVFLKLKGITQATIEEYLKDNQAEARTVIGTDWHTFAKPTTKTMYKPNPLIQEAVDSLPSGYREFYEKDFIEELKKYRLDYILSDGTMPEQLYDELAKNIEPVFEHNGWILYSFK